MPQLTSQGEFHWVVYQNIIKSCNSLNVYCTTLFLNDMTHGPNRSVDVIHAPMFWVHQLGGLNVAWIKRINELHFNNSFLIVMTMHLIKIKLTFRLNIWRIRVSFFVCGFTASNCHLSLFLNGGAETRLAPKFQVWMVELKATQRLFEVVIACNIVVYSVVIVFYSYCDWSKCT